MVGPGARREAEVDGGTVGVRIRGRSAGRCDGSSISMLETGWTDCTIFPRIRGKFCRAVALRGAGFDNGASYARAQGRASH